MGARGRCFVKANASRIRSEGLISAAVQVRGEVSVGINAELSFTF